ncbi:hypothetical protein DPMN_070237 [Dreissena polymorpha]|uniref:Uncharacterized protein n=1 Tax=Dreissena polymorpha TaxID=45954 RepID=A0A9D3Z0X9_DREPO|nr:hypothetical protein DPMN_070237 [Dreissena polymorpha]
MRDQAVKVSSEVEMNGISESECYMLDGASLLHRLPWKKGDTNNAIAKSSADLRTRSFYHTPETRTRTKT